MPGLFTWIKRLWLKMYRRGIGKIRPRGFPSKPEVQKGCYVLFSWPFEFCPCSSVRKVPADCRRNVILKMSIAVYLHFNWIYFLRDSRFKVFNSAVSCYSSSVNRRLSCAIVAPVAALKMCEIKSKWALYFRCSTAFYWVMHGNTCCW